MATKCMYCGEELRTDEKRSLEFVSVALRTKSPTCFNWGDE